MEIDKKYFSNLIDTLEVLLKSNNNISPIIADAVEGKIIQGKALLAKEEEKLEKLNKEKLTRNFVTQRSIERASHHID